MKFDAIETTNEFQIHGWLAMVVVSEPKTHDTMVSKIRT
ncbi:hypothetical protein NC652_007330 [Populus alba x Populus x berolinensis]|uniref:Uncharacterized protein n=1 Tax=Populus alba x Populus x berolinensis TaxID=444605 RepID=A0AAD6WFH7_9ROSI|nr:hypothetical protein NC652_007330 [Populus alba x Populus x berolinensis]KAJ7008544.1 hypothetical protein NC653_007265 [Populus alba x Populus x berolinensis]